MKYKYEPGDIATFYFIINNSSNRNYIKAWTDDKNLAEFYMMFHKCPRFKIKKVVRSIEEINKMIDENYFDEISIANIIAKDNNSDDGKKLISIPLTGSELQVINDECNSFLSTFIEYSYISNSMSYLKNKYLEILDDILLVPIIDYLQSNVIDKRLGEIDMDQMIILLRSFPDDFDV